MYYEGEGVIQSFEKALKYYLLSANQGHMESQFQCGMYVCMYVYLYVCMYACMYVCMYIYI